MAAVALLLTACGSSDPTTVEVAETTAAPTTAAATTGEAAVPSGYELFDGSENGFEIALPEDWTFFGPDDLDFGDFLSDVDFGDASQYAQIQDQIVGMFNQGGVLFAFDFGRGTEDFVDNVNVLRAPSSSLSASGHQKLNEDQYQAFGATVLASDVAQVAAGEAAVLRYEIPEFGSFGISYTIPTDDNDWFVTISVRDLDNMSLDPDLVINSFRVVP